MEWLVELVKAAFTFLGVFLTVHYTLKGKKLELASAHDAAVAECQKTHKGDIEKVKAEFNSRLDELSGKMDEIKTEQMKTIFTVTQVKEGQDKYNNVIARTFKLEEEVAVLKNRESVSEHRLTDLERK